jgi:hypothetical protein
MDTVREAVSDSSDCMKRERTHSGSAKEVQDRLRPLKVMTRENYNDFLMEV